ncbi:MAG: M48 family metallopeptidase [Alphaproteobacteria bacterium]|nr:M48 family metallopeptidase [Alphaproteobacteria bacterium]
MRIEGTLHPPASSEAVPAALVLADGVLAIDTETDAPRPVIVERFYDRISGVPRRVMLGDGSHFVTRDDRYFRRSTLPDDRKRAITALFDRLADGGDLAGPIRLEFRQGNRYGANALALPGGIVVITDEMVARLADDKLIGAVLAHEIGHVEGRHGLRRFIRVAFWSLLFGLVVGDIGSVTDELVAAPTLVIARGYGR